MKNIAKKFLSLLLAAIMIFGAAISDTDFKIHSKAVASEAGKCGENLQWLLYEDTKQLVISGTGDMEDYSSVGASPWYKYEFFTVIIREGVTSIGDHAFECCYDIENVTIGSTVTKIGKYAFENCDSLQNIFIPDSVTEVGDFAFNGCDSLMDASIGSGVEIIGDAAFGYCASLTQIVVNSENEFFSNDGGVLFDKDKTVLIRYPMGHSRTSYKVPNSVGRIGEYAFSYCLNLTDVDLSDGVISIDAWAFSDCDALKSVTLGDDLAYVEEYAFFQCSGLSNVYYSGTEDEFKSVTVLTSGNDCFAAATKYYNNTNSMSKYTVTWVVDGVSTVDEYESGEEIIKPNNPPKTGFVFIGWTPEVPDIMPENDLIFTAVFEKIVEEDIYNLGEETYSFDNFGDSDSAGGHCFGMSMTSSAYYTGELDISTVGGSEKKNLYTLTLNNEVRKPICKYQDIQGNYSLNATVAGGSYYKNRTYNIDSDWTEVINYVKNHEYDNKGTLQIGFRKNGEGGHAINFLRYEEVNGQQRIYAYDNNFPDAETYFYKDANGKIQQAPYSTFSGSIDCIALRSVSKYFDVVDNFDSTRYIYADRDTISVNGVNVYPIDGEVEMGERVMFEIPANVEQVTITPLVDNAEFEYLDEEYSFGSVNDDTVGVFTLATTDDNSGSTDTDFTILNGGTATASVDIRKPSTTTISYGDAIILHVDVQNLPAGSTIKWTASNGNFDFDVSSDGKTCEIAPSSSGDTEFTAEIVDSNGNSIGRDTQKMTSKAGFWQKIIAFFKSIFGLTKVIPQSFFKV